MERVRKLPGIQQVLVSKNINRFSYFDATFCDLGNEYSSSELWGFKEHFYSIKLTCELPW